MAWTAFVSGIYSGDVLSGGTLIYVVLQNFSEIKKSEAEFNSDLQMPAVRHLGCLKETYLDYSTRWGTPFYLHAGFGEDILIGGGDMPQN